jgi:hypothetical protein
VLHRIISLIRRDRGNLLIYNAPIDFASEFIAKADFQQSLLGAPYQ